MFLFCILLAWQYALNQSDFRGQVVFQVNGVLMFAYEPYYYNTLNVQASKGPMARLMQLFC